MANKNFIAQQGFLTYAFNNSTNYLNLAYLQALSIKLTQKENKVALIVNEETNKSITEKHNKVFDKILISSAIHPFNDYWTLFRRTPFKETIFVESDLLFTRDLNHWWNSFRFKNICLSLHCKNFLQENVSNTKFRSKLLPNVYTGLMYFRYSTEALAFFNLVKRLTENWEQLNIGKSNSPDHVFSLACLLFGEENCTIPTLDFLNFTHMKSAIQKWTENQPWTDFILVEDDLPLYRINNVNQYHPLHYYEKDFATLERIENYERRLGIA